MNLALQINSVICTAAAGRIVLLKPVVSLNRGICAEYSKQKFFLFLVMRRITWSPCMSPLFTIFVYFLQRIPDEQRNGVITGGRVTYCAWKDVNGDFGATKNLLNCSIVNVSHDAVNAIIMLDFESDYTVTVESETSAGYNESLTLERVVLLGKSRKITLLYCEYNVMILLLLSQKSGMSGYCIQTNITSKC